MSINLKRIIAFSMFFWSVGNLLRQMGVEFWSSVIFPAIITLCIVFLLDKGAK